MKCALHLIGCARGYRPAQNIHTVILDLMSLAVELEGVCRQQRGGSNVPGGLRPLRLTPLPGGRQPPCEDA